MNVGFVGLGKLGLPVAMAMAARRLRVYGVDPWPEGPPDISGEQGFEATQQEAGDRLRYTDLTEMVRACAVIFVAVQTPHEERFEGTTSLPKDRADFDYTALVGAVGQIRDEVERQRRQATIVVVSTVLPGTMRERIIPILGDRLRLVYNPSFIAMSTVIRDFLDPEFVLLGGDDDRMIEIVYTRIIGTRHKFVRVGIDEAELIKVSYNTFIGLKITYANTLMEICQKIGCDVDAVTSALKQADRRLISTAYLNGGMGDGGGCHPRDNIALSWLARKLDLSFDIFGAAMLCRERQTDWLCEMMESAAEANDLPMVILGTEFKPGVASEVGSPAILARNLLRERGCSVRLVRRGGLMPDYPAVFLIGCMHPEYATTVFPKGSVVIDPNRYIPDHEGVTVLRIGERRTRVGELEGSATW